MQRLEVDEQLVTVDCAPYLQRLVLEDPDPSSPLYIPKPPPRSYETLSKAIEAKKFLDQSATPAPKTMEASRGVNMRDRKPARDRQAPRAEERTSRVQRQMADFHRGMDFAQDDPFSIGGDPFGGGSSYPFGREGGFGQDDEDPFGGIGEPLYPDTPHFRDKAESQYARAQKYRNSEDAGDQEDDEPDVEEQEGGEEEDDADVQNESSYRYSEPMYTPGDEQLMQDARNLRERDGIPYHESQDSLRENAEETGYTDPVAKGTGPCDPVAEGTGQDGTGSEVVPNEEGRLPRKKLKEKFMKDREELERTLNAQGLSIYGDRAPTQEEGGGGEGGDPDDPSGLGPPAAPRVDRRIMSGQEIKQQMAMQKFAMAALKAISRGGKKGGGKRGGKVRVMFM